MNQEINVESKIMLEKRIDLGSNVMLDQERCVHFVQDA